MQTNKINLKRWIGIDGGGTKTSCVIGDEQGQILAMANGASSNIQGVSHEKVRTTLFELIENVITDSNSTIEEIEGIYLCLAGADRKKDREVIKGFFKNTDYASKIRITNDAKAALVAGTWGESGLLLIAGTGSIVYGVSNETQQMIRVGGWGYLLGDEGRGFYIGKQALNAVLKAFDKRGAKTTLTASLLNHFQVSDEKDLISIYSEELLVPNIAKLSKYVLEEAKNEDAVAKRIIFDSIRELIQMVKAANDQLDEPAQLLVLHGGLFSDSYFKMLFLEQLNASFKNMKTVQSELPAVVGAYLLALIKDGQVINDVIKSNIRSTWQNMNHHHLLEKK